MSSTLYGHFYVLRCRRNVRGFVLMTGHQHEDCTCMFDN